MGIYKAFSFSSAWELIIEKVSLTPTEQEKNLQVQHRYHFSGRMPWYWLLYTQLFFYFKVDQSYLPEHEFVVGYYVSAPAHPQIQPPPHA